MTAPHDTPEAVEAYASLLDIREDQRVMDPTIAAMLRRLHSRAVEVERERDQAYKSGFADGYEDGEKAALATARADALRGAAEVARCVPIPDDASAEEAHGRISAALQAAINILALLPKEPTP
jgi:hypothetical protein